MAHCDFFFSIASVLSKLLFPWAKRHVFHAVVEDATSRSLVASYHSQCGLASQCQCKIKRAVFIHFSQQRCLTPGHILWQSWLSKLGFIFHSQHYPYYWEPSSKSVRTISKIDGITRRGNWTKVRTAPLRQCPVSYCRMMLSPVYRVMKSITFATICSSLSLEMVQLWRLP